MGEIRIFAILLSEKYSILIISQFSPLFSNIVYKHTKYLKHFNFSVVFNLITKIVSLYTKSAIPFVHKSGVCNIPCKKNSYISQTWKAIQNIRYLFKFIYSSYNNKHQLSYTIIGEHSQKAVHY